MTAAHWILLAALLCAAFTAGFKAAGWWRRELKPRHQARMILAHASNVGLFSDRLLGQQFAAQVAYLARRRQSVRRLPGEVTRALYLLTEEAARRRDGDVTHPDSFAATVAAYLDAHGR